MTCSFSFTMEVLLKLFAAILIIFHSVSSQKCSLDPNGHAEKVEVLILGGGMAGVSAARKLEVSDVANFMLFEATDRLGGRIREDPATRYEIGANWIQGLDPEDKLRHPIWREWIRCDAGGPLGSSTPYVGSAFADDGSPIDIPVYEEAESRIATACEELEEVSDSFYPDISVREGLQRQGWEPSSALENMTDWLFLDFCSGVRAENLSVKLYYEETFSAFTGTQDGAEAGDYLISDERGYSFVVRCLAREFMAKIKLNAPVTEIQTAEDCVCVAVDNNDKRYCGDYAIVTFSIGVLQAAIREEENAVQFEPALPEEKQAAINSISLARYAKVRLTFNITFWNVSDEAQHLTAYVSNERGWYPYILFDNNIPNTILFEVAEELALKVDNQPVDTTTEEVMNVLRRIYGNDIPDPVNVVVSNWTNDPYIRHVWTGFDVGLPLNITDQLMSPVGRLYFAGESLNSSFYGFTHGAYGSGAHVATTVLDKMASTAANNLPVPSAVALMTAITLFFC